jgi:hypothetical protein
MRWTVSVPLPPAARETSPPEIVAALPSERLPAEPPRVAVTALTQADVRDWLHRYEQAWEARDVDRLQALGIVRAHQAEATRQALRVYERLEVSIENEQIAIDGQQARVSFDRSDVDEKGKKLVHPRQSFRLEKGPGGVVAVGKGPAGDS